jgi:hypothetical protein
MADKGPKPKKKKGKIPRKNDKKGVPVVHSVARPTGKSLPKRGRLKPKLYSPNQKG